MIVPVSVSSKHPKKKKRSRLQSIIRDLGTAHKNYHGMLERFWKNQWFWPSTTLPETNIAPENGWLEYYFPIGVPAYFQGLLLLVSGSVTHLPSNSSAAAKSTWIPSTSMFPQSHRTNHLTSATRSKHMRLAKSNLNGSAQAMGKCTHTLQTWTLQMRGVLPGPYLKWRRNAFCNIHPTTISEGLIILVC